MEKCNECGKRKKDVIDGLCEECEAYYVYCSVCNENVHEYDAGAHRHFWWQPELGWWVGPGVDTEEITMQKIKQSFFAVLKKTGIAVPLERTIKADKMGFDAIHFVGTTFGYSSVWCCLLGEPKDTYGSGLLFCGERFTANLTDEEEEVMSDGVGWLIALDNEKTTEVNKLTLQWLDEWNQLEETNVNPGA